MQGSKLYCIYGYNNPFPDYCGDGDNKKWKILSKRKCRRYLKSKIRILNKVHKSF